MRTAKAVVVGIDNYVDAPLNGCVSDANEMAEMLRTHASGRKNFDVDLVTCERGEVTRQRLHKAALAAFSGKADVALFYFSGHGYVHQLGGYLVTPDHSEYAEGLSMTDLINLADQARERIRNRIIILDCCYSGKAGVSETMGGAIAQIHDGMTIMTASRKDEAALERGGHGVFTALILSALEGAASDLLGNVTPGMIYAHVDRALGAFEQRPVFRTNVEEFVPLRESAPPIPLGELQKIDVLFPSSDFVLPLDPTFEFTHEKAIEKNTVTLRLLQKYSSLGLVAPEDGDHVPPDEMGFMYFAAVRSRSCHLTDLGKYYLRLRQDRRF